MPEFDYIAFVSSEKSMLIAPAGYGKTHTISECLKHTNGKQLILTHTHAGVASIKEKLRKALIPNSNFNVETITSFSQKYVTSFYVGNNIPEQDDGKKYYPFIIGEAIKIFKKKPVRDIIQNTYTGLFVDEYQDCTLQHHELILTVSELLPTRILGDYLQGIFGFNGESLVDMREQRIMGAFMQNQFALVTPWRWANGENPQLGSHLHEIRSLLNQRQAINLRTFQSLELRISDDIYRYNSNELWSLLAREKSLLIIHPDSQIVDSRIKFIQRFNNLCHFIESIDSKEFYLLSKKIDSITTQNLYVAVLDVCNTLFGKTGIKNWFNADKLKRKQNLDDQASIRPVELLLFQLKQNISYAHLKDILIAVDGLTGVKCYRKELFTVLCKALEAAEHNKTTAYQAMVNSRNATRRMGRKIYGKCIGTTLLTKGLEFDTVLVLDAHKFKCPKHLYVALTRASKKLIVFSNTAVLTPYQ